MQQTALRIGIFLGGISSEKEISLESGRHIYNNLNREKYEIVPLFVDGKNHLWEINEGLLWMNTCADLERSLAGAATRIFYEDLKGKIDFVYSALHGKYGEECVPALLKTLGIPNNTSGVLGGSIGMDKLFQRKLLTAAGLTVPKYKGIELQRYSDVDERVKVIDEIEKEFTYPFIVKPHREGCSMGISRVKNKEGVEKALEEAFAWDTIALVEEYLRGMEVTTTVLGNDEPYALTPTETPYKGDFLTAEEKFLPGDATMITPPRLPESDIRIIQEECVKAYRAMQQQVMARIDGIWKDGKLYILEPNSPPGQTPSTCIFHQAAQAGMSISDFFDTVISFGLERG